MSRISSLSGKFLFRGISTLVLISILMAIFLYATDDMDRQSEKIAQERVIDEINIALSFHLYQAAIKGKLNELSSLHMANPFKVLSGANYKPPKSYRGEVSSDENLSESGWYFELEKKAILYLSRDNAVQSYQLQLLFTDLNQTGQFEAHADSIDQLKMMLVN